jgi:hypothetical protein
MAEGFGKVPPTDSDRWVEQIVRHCRERQPEALDCIFDKMHVGRTVEASGRLSQRVMAGVCTQLQPDVDTLAWFCGYLASEINRSEDNERDRLPLTELSKKLINLGFTVFKDFVPYSGRRIVIVSPEKFEALPESERTEIEQAFTLLEESGEQLWQINEALREELMVTE